MNRAIILGLVLVIGLLTLAAISTDQPTSEYLGTATLKDGHFWLNAGDNVNLRLLLASDTFLDTLGLHLSEGDTLLVDGIRQNDLLLVGNLTKIGLNEKLYKLRDFKTGQVYPGAASYGVNQGQCIGCKLCVMNCPVGAITMIKGKAHIDPAKCTECGICIEGYQKFKGCPVKAISPK